MYVGKLKIIRRYRDNNVFTDEIAKEKVSRLINALNSKDAEGIEKAKYEVLLDCANLDEIITHFLALDQFGVNFDFGTSTIKKGTKLYRIRRFDNGVDFNEASQWTAPPRRLQNRANRQGQEALYLGSTENICLFETHIQQGEKYALATYECVDDIVLSGFFTHKNDLRHHIAGVTLNAFFIAPSRNETNKKLFEFLDEYYGDLQPDDITDWKTDFDLPLRFAVLNKRNQYYEMTNMIADVLRKQSSYGIRYSSCYLPMETLGIVCSDYNVVLYDKGIENIKFIGTEIKTNDKQLSDVGMLKIVCEISEKDRKSKKDCNEGLN